MAGADYGGVIFEVRNKKVYKRIDAPLGMIKTSEFGMGGTKVGVGISYKSKWLDENNLPQSFKKVGNKIQRGNAFVITKPTEFYTDSNSTDIPAVIGYIRNSDGSQYIGAFGYHIYDTDTIVDRDSHCSKNELIKGLNNFLAKEI